MAMGTTVIEDEELGRAWLRLVKATSRLGHPMGDEGTELLGVAVSFAARTSPDPVIERFGDREMVGEMEKVFFGSGPNALGHSYAHLIRGPDGRSDFQDVASHLQADRFTKRAVVMLPGTGNGKVPCINVVQFLVREGSVQCFYFARAQDAFRKFYADGLCIAAMAGKVGGLLGLPTGRITGFIGSSHVYHRDASDIAKMLAEAIPASGVREGRGA